GKFEFTFSPNEMKDTPWNIWPKPWQQVQVVVAKEGMGAGWCNLGQLKSRLKIWMRGTAPLRGKVIDLQGQPLPDCRVDFYSIEDNQPAFQELWQPTWEGLSKNVVTDAKGQFEILGLPTNRKKVRLVVSGPSIATKIFSVDIGPNGRAPVEVIVKPTKPIEGTVRDRDTGEPISGVVVYGEQDKNHRLVRALTNARGEYRLIGLPKSKRYQLTTYSPFSKGYLTRYTSVSDTPELKAVPHEIRMRRGLPVHLTLIDKKTRKRLHPEVHYSPTTDNPLHREAGSALYWPMDEHRRMHAADENGVVRFLAYPGRGLVSIVLQGGGYLPVGDTKEITENMQSDPTFGFASLGPAYRAINPKPGDGVLKVELEADPGESQSAKLIDEQGKSIHGAKASNLYYNAYLDSHSVGSEEAAYEEPLKSDAFTVHLLEPNKPRMLVFLHREKKLIGLTTATAGQPLSNVVMQQWGTVEGVVSDAKGQPLSNIEVEVKYPKPPASGKWPQQPVAKTDARGRFIIERLLPGQNHKLTVKAPAGLVSKEVSNIKTDVGETRNVGTIRLDQTPAK
ncbi:MAG: carboxypeptidase regulatory-like domain-containing protein, partial [Planctomycetaceae bacterium]|nr:carboxypeptidase regulatory-like domain-containing protein [Planctomycetaceae bacterium]